MGEFVLLLCAEIQTDTRPRDRINQGKVRFKDGNGATLELFKLAAELGQDLRKLQE